MRENARAADVFGSLEACDLGLAEEDDQNTMQEVAFKREGRESEAREEADRSIVADWRVRSRPRGRRVLERRALSQCNCRMGTLWPFGCVYD